MFRYLERLRDAPREERRRAALIITLVLFLVVIVLWLGFSFFRSVFLSAAPALLPASGESIVPPYER